MDSQNNIPYIDEDCIVSFHIGESGWLIQEWQGYLRYLKQNKYKDIKFIMFMNPDYHCLVNDFVYMTINLPDWFKELYLDQDCYEAVLSDSPAGSLTPIKVYTRLLNDIRKYYNPQKAIEIYPPRGCNDWCKHQPQAFSIYKSDYPINSIKPIICVFPRNRIRASNRNVPPFIWKEVVDRLKDDFLVVLGGTPSGACLSDYPENENVVNLISYNEEDKLERIIAYLNNSSCSISSQSFLSSVSMLSNCPTYMIGHQRERHCIDYNRANIPTSFRYVYDYRVIDSDTIVSDVYSFITELNKVNYFGNRILHKINRPSLRTLEGKKDLIGVEIGTSNGDNAVNILENLDIKKLYLIDPYKNYDQFQEQDRWEKEAHSRLDKFNDKIIWVRKTSEDALNDIPDNLDFCYIDGSHHYADVKKDIINYYPKVKLGGLITFHDFEFGEVNTAVNEIIKEKIYAEQSQDCKPIDAWIIKNQFDAKYEDVLNNDIEILKELM
jgi:hypothetical protein